MLSTTTIIILIILIIILKVNSSVMTAEVDGVSSPLHPFMCVVDLQFMVLMQIEASSHWPRPLKSTQTHRKRERYLKLFENCHWLCHPENRDALLPYQQKILLWFFIFFQTKETLHREPSKKVFFSTTEDSLVCHFASDFPSLRRVNWLRNVI